MYTEDKEPSNDHTERLAKLAAFSSSVTRMRREAVEFRSLSGIETRWQEDEDYNEGTDELSGRTQYLKSATSGGPLTSGNRNSSLGANRSTAFLNITAPYNDMVAARIADMVLPTEDKPFALRPTPIPETSDDAGMMPDGQARVGDAAKAFLDEMGKKSEAAETQIWDWLLEAGWHREMRKVIEQAVILGTGCLKGPFPVKFAKKTANADQGTDYMDGIRPASKQVDIRNIFPDPSCGDDIHNGSYIFEREYISCKQLRELKGLGYLDDQIDEVLKEGPSKRNIESNGTVRQKPNLESDIFECWYFTGTAEQEDLIAANCACNEEKDNYSVTITLINDRIIKASRTILDTDSLPYDIMVYKRCADTWAGIGVSSQVRTAQRIVLAASRNLLVNAGVSAGPQIIIRQGIVVPADGDWTVTPMKVWLVSEDADIQNVQNAITSIAIPSMQKELQEIIKMALEFAERATSMPLILQGQQGGNPTETLGGLQLQEQNASTVLRRIAKTFDDSIIKPHIERFYEWLMLYSEDEAMKGDYVINALGSSTFYQRDASNVAIMQLVPMIANPVFGLNPEKIIIELLKANKITPERVMLTDDEKKELAANQPPPQEDPKIAAMKEIAQMKAASDKDLETLKQQSDTQDVDMKERMAQADLAGKLQMQKAEHELQLKLKAMERDIKIMELSASREISIGSIKAALADTSLRLQTEKELKMGTLQHDAHVLHAEQKHEVGMKSLNDQTAQDEAAYNEGLADKAKASDKPYEPAGKAPKGQAFNL